MKHWRFLASCVFCLGMVGGGILACGGEDDDGTPGGIGNGGGSASYFPLTVGSSWEYRHSSNVGPSHTRTQTVTAPLTVTHTYIQSGSPASTSTLHFEIIEGRICLSRAVSGQTIQTTYSPPPPVLPTTTQTGHVETIGPITVTTQYPGYPTSTSTYTQTLEILGRESITVPAGTFQNALKVKYTFTTTSGGYPSYSWLVEGIGSVKNATPGEVSAETVLTSYDIR